MLASLSSLAMGLSPSVSFEEYTAHFGKVYGVEELATRRSIFESNVAVIVAQNERESTGASSWKAGINKFSDWTNDEFRAQRTASLPSTMRNIKGTMGTQTPSFSASGPLADSVDWRVATAAGLEVLTPVKDQGGCGSCWAFSAVETFEAALALKTGKPSPILSTQQIVSCTPNPNDCGGTGGCEGATQQLAFNYTMKAGMTTGAQYPYKGQDSKCDTAFKPVAKNTGYWTVMPNNYTDLMHSVSRQPIAITVAAGGIGWQVYSSGVYSGGILGCGYALDHGVQLAGYGATAQGEKYWCVFRNSSAREEGAAMLKSNFRWLPRCMRAASRRAHPAYARPRPRPRPRALSLSSLRSAPAGSCATHGAAAGGRRGTCT